MTALRNFVPPRFRPSGHIEHLARTRTNDRVWSGPFSGMRCLPGINGRMHIPKLLGIYERELGPFVEEVCESKFELITVAGAAEGYYAIGFALRNPSAQVVAFEMEPGTRQLLVQAANLNGVGRRMDIRGKCEPGELESVLSNAIRPFLICDVEGYESVLLDPDHLPSLRNATILVELHEFVTRGVTATIRERFIASHTITDVWQQDRASDEFPFRDLYTRLLPQSYLLWAVGESRPERMSWLWMEPII